jgi:Matrixin
LVQDVSFSEQIKEPLVMTLFDSGIDTWAEATTTQTSVLVAKNPTSQKSPLKVKVDKELWGGQTVEQDGGTFDNEVGQGRLVSPIEFAMISLSASSWLNQNGINTSNSKATVRVENSPKHGVLQELVDGKYRYTPKSGFIGKDFVSFIVTLQGKIIRVNLPLFVVKNIEEPKALYNSPGQLQNEVTSDLASWQKSSDLMNLLADASQTFTGFSDLAGTAVGQTNGEGANAAITLDSNAAGHGWYVDATPWDNTDDYLPTADAGVWQAKVGTAAATQMDLLSVLLHEYGHALGLAHSANPRDFMAASLQPGIRRLPTQAELQLMSELVAKLKVGMSAGLGHAVATAADTSMDATTGAPSNAPANTPIAPTNPLTALGLLPLGFIRRQSRSSANDSAIGNGTNTSANAGQLANVDYLSAANATLINGNFAGATPALSKD